MEDMWKYTRNLFVNLLIIITIQHHPKGLHLHTPLVPATPLLATENRLCSSV